MSNPCVSPEVATTRPGYDQQQLAAARTRMANERTLLTYVRTSLALLAFGLTLLQLHPGRGKMLGYGALVASGTVMLTGWGRFRYHRQQIENCRLMS
jgi:putative membrane protein